MTARPMASDLRQIPGPLVAGDAHGPGEGGADGHAHGGDFVLGLQGAHAETLQIGEVMQNIAGRRDRIAGVDQRNLGKLRRRGQADGDRLVAGDLAIFARA